MVEANFKIFLSIYNSAQNVILPFLRQSIKSVLCLESFIKHTQFSPLNLIESSILSILDGKRGFEFYPPNLTQ